MKHPLLLFLMVVGLLLVSCKSEDDLPLETAGIDQDEDNTTAKLDESYVYQLPVVFHVLYQDASDKSQYVDANRLKEILLNVNDLWKGNIYGESENMGVHFVLAKQDEAGKTMPIPGVEYIKYEGTYPIDAYDFMKQKSNLKYIWDPNEYINVMVYNFKEEEKSGLLLGISHMPLTIKSDSALAGLETTEYRKIPKNRLSYAPCTSINSSLHNGKSIINTQSTRYTLADKGKKGYEYSSADVNVTLAHELGHYLGLHHVFAEEKNDKGYTSIDDCQDTDYCEDTPSYNILEYNKMLTQYIEQKKQNHEQVQMKDVAKRINCSNESFLSENYMDYAISYSFRFTPDQKKRVRNVLYYSPLIPGPKKNGANGVPPATRASADNGKPYDLPITIVK